MSKSTKVLTGTLIKVGLLVAGVILLILSVVCVPAVLGRSGLIGMQEESTRGGLDQIRSAIKLFAEDHGKYPTDPAKELVPQYLREIREVTLSPRAHFWPSRRVMYFDSLSPGDSGTWGYVNNPISPDFGKFFVNCTHIDGRGKTWRSY